MPVFSSDEGLWPSLVLVPAQEEISDYSGTNSYYCGLEITKDSVYRLVDKMAAEVLSGRAKDQDAWPRLSRIEGEEAGFEPEVIFRLALTILSGRVSLAFIRLLKLWVAERNGRKMRVRLPDGFEIEATQLNYKQFRDLFADLHSTYVARRQDAAVEEWIDAERKLRENLRERKLIVLDEESASKEVAELRRIYWEKARKLGRGS